jgi:hypothetical protein
VTTAKMGGQPRLKVLAVGGAELTDVIASAKDGGRKLTTGLREKLAATYEGKFDLDITAHPAVTMKELSESVSSLNGSPDVVLLSVLADVTAKGHLDTDGFEADARKVVNTLKEMGAHVIFANVSTIDPHDTVTNYHGLSDDPPSLRAHKTALAILDLSNQLGVSVIDADRLLAEMGAAAHVEKIGHYDAQASDVICEEIKRILEDYGFFENRPVMAQSGKRG